MERSDIINEIIKHHKFEKYLEIGVAHPERCFDKIEVKVKHSVDPGVEVPEKVAMYPLTSDDFFSSLKQGKLNLESDYKWDLIFIDGLHLCDQVEKDAINAFNQISDNGYIVFHDCSPPTVHHAREDYSDKSTPAGWLWNGTTWKAIQKLRQGKIINSSIDVITVNEDWGCTILRKGNGESYIFDPSYNQFYEFYKFDEKRKEILNLKSSSEFFEWLNKR
jgi:hypothetical protein